MDVLDISDLTIHSLPALEYFSLQCPELNIFDSQLDIKKRRKKRGRRREQFFSPYGYALHRKSQCMIHRRD